MVLFLLPLTRWFVRCDTGWWVSVLLTNAPCWFRAAAEVAAQDGAAKEKLKKTETDLKKAEAGAAEASKEKAARVAAEAEKDRVSKV